MFKKFEALSGSTFVGIRGYANKNGEIANVTVNVGASYQNVLNGDLNKLNTITDESINQIAIETNLPKEILLQAIVELIDSIQKNLSKDLENHTNQSKGQIDAYIPICKGIKLHKESLNVNVFGFLNKKTIIQEGTYPPSPKSRPLTIAKNELKKRLDLQTEKYRIYNIENIESVKIQGNEIILNEK